jgi:hypothetical protein
MADLTGILFARRVVNKLFPLTLGFVLVLLVGAAQASSSGDGDSDSDSDSRVAKPTASSRCEAAMDRATGRYANCLLKVSARAARHGEREPEQAGRTKDDCRDTFKEHATRALQRHGVENCTSLVAEMEHRTANFAAAIAQEAGGDPSLALLFVQSADGGELSGSTLTLSGVSENTAWFSDRPYRETGVTSTADFVSAWGEGPDPFSLEPPNADFSCEVGGEVVNYFVELTNPVLSGDELSYTVSFIGGGSSPGVTQCDHDAHLFIDNAQTSGGGGDCQQCGASSECGLIDRGGGFIYDSHQDITWTQDANINGLDNWDNQMTWVAGYSQTHSEYGTFDDWRLPTTKIPDPTCNAWLGPNTGRCLGSEMGHLAEVDNITSNSMGLFTNVGENYYWSGTEDPPNSGEAWMYLLDVNGVQWNSGAVPDNGRSDQWDLYAWAVRDGDVACGAPEPPPPPPGSWQQSCDTGTADWHESSDGAWCATCDWACWTGICLPWDSCVDVNQCPSGSLENNNGDLQCSP